jgi:hypothetical protein
MNLKSVAKSARTLLGVVEKRKNGVFVSRPVLNAQAWFDWATQHGVPNIVPVDEMHVTVVYSTVDVKMVPDPLPTSVSTLGYDPGAFMLFGPDENVLVYAFNHWGLLERYYSYLNNGAVSKWPTYRPHMTISTDFAGYEIPDEALATAPREIIMGGEVFADVKATDAPADDSDPEGTGEDDESDVIIVIEVARAAAKSILETQKSLSVLERAALADIMLAPAVTKGLAERMAKSPWATDDLKKLFVEATGVTKTRQGFVNIGPVPIDVAKKLNGALVRKTNDEERMLVGIANVSTVKGQLVKDSDGDHFTTQALTEWMRKSIQGERGVDFDHATEPSMELVQGFVLSEDIQKALGIDLGYEPALVEVHIADDDSWNKVKDGDWMFSIAGQFYYEGTENG